MYVPLAQKRKIRGHFVPKGQVIRIFLLELNQIVHEKIAFVLLPKLKSAQKSQFGFLGIK
jgi:hypothetical protein